MKTCFKCRTQKPLDEFYKHSEMLDGHLNKCKECTKSDVKKHRDENIDRIRAYDRNRPNAKERMEKDKIRAKLPHRKELSRISHKKYEIKYSKRKKAVSMLGNAVRDKRVIPWPVCLVPECNEKPQGHHVHYDLPLDVVWLCVKHHAQVHKETREYFRNYKKQA